MLGSKAIKSSVLYINNPLSNLLVTKMNGIIGKL